MSNVFLFRQLRVFFAACTVLVVLLPAKAQSVAHERAAAIVKGQNLSNWLEAYWQSNYPNPEGYTRQSIMQMQEAGMRSLRLPVTFEYFTDTLPPYAIHTNNATFALIDSAITWAADFDMLLIIDNHHGWEVNTANYLQQVPRMAAMWKQLAQYFAGLDPDRYLFEIWNEPPILLPESYIRPFYQACLDSIRTTDTLHTLVVGAHAANLGLALAATTPYADNNLIYTFHSYEPYNFTHQGFPWAEPFPFPVGTPFPLNNNDTLLTNIYTSVANWRNVHNVPVFLGEFGVGVHADDQSRCNWIALTGALLNEFNIPWIYWDWQYDFSWFEQLPPASGNMTDCFNDALQVYESSGTQPHPAVSSNIRLYPNPAQEWCNLQLPAGFGGFSLQVYNLAGKICLQQTFGSHATAGFSTGNLQKGMYFVAVNNGRQQITLPLLVY